MQIFLLTMLGLMMFTMGLSLTAADFARVVRVPLAALLAAAMPSVAVSNSMNSTRPREAAQSFTFTVDDTAPAQTLV